MNALRFIALLACVITCHTELDIEVIILDDKNFNSSKFVESIAEFNPVAIVNGTELPLLLSPPSVKVTGFLNPVMCVGTECYSEKDLVQPTPTPTPTPVSDSPTSGSDVVVIASSVSSVVVVILGVMCYCLVKRRRTNLKINSRFQRVVIRETIDLPPQLAQQIVKTGSKHTRGFV
jgi:hypothetical protein